jgi:mRNA-degrading endonuclease RelE of RelBE toxin-antitoxin system
MAYSIEYEAAAWRQFKKLDKATQLRLTPKIDALATSPTGSKKATRL